MSELDTWLHSHFQKVEESRSEAHQRHQALAAAMAELRTRFTTLAGTIIRPRMAIVRDFLMKRNYPAIISEEPIPGNFEGRNSYLGLHCANDPSDLKVVQANRDAPFALSYFVQGDGTYMMLTTSRRGEKKACTLAEITEDRVDNDLRALVEAMIPAW